MLDTPSVFDVMETDHTQQRVAARQALALAHKRVESNLGRFLRAAQSEDEFFERLALVQEDFAGFVTTASVEVGHEHPEHIAAALRDSYRLAAGVEFEKTEGEEEEEDEDEKKKKKFPFSSSVHEARRPRMCPYHNEVVNASLGTGDPKAGYDVMAQHAWSANHCQGPDYEGPSCKFKSEMVTQSYWDNRSQQAEEKRQVIPSDEPAVEQPAFEAPPEEAPVSDSEPIDVAPEGTPSDMGEMPSESLSEAPEATLEPVAASWKNFSHIGGVNMLDAINGPAAGQAPQPPQPGLPGQIPGQPQPGLPQQQVQPGGLMPQQPQVPGAQPMPVPGAPQAPPQQTEQQQMQDRLKSLAG